MTHGWSSCAKIASSVVECWSWKPIPEAILEKYTLKMSATSLLLTIVSSPSRYIVWFPFRNFLSEKKGDIIRQKVLSCLAQLVSKYFVIDFLHNDTTWFRRRRFSSQYFFAKYSEFVSSHIPAIKRLAQFGVHVRHWLSFDKLRLDRWMTIYDVTDERTCIPSHIISIVEDVYDMKRCTLQIKKEIGVIKRFITLIYNFLWLYCWGETPSSTPYCVEIRMFRVKWLNTIADGDLIRCVAMSSASTVL